MNHDYPILEYDDSLLAIIEPSKVVKPTPNMPQHVVYCFFQDAIESLCGEGKAQVIGHLGSEIGRNPIYRYQHDRQAIAIIHPGVGAPLSGTFLEETISKGGKKFIACGGAGVLDSTISLGHLVIPESAIRDEGTSYHYLPPSREVSAHPDAVAAIKRVLKKHNIPYSLGKTWTTDAPYRETPSKVQNRRDEGALTVEMEAAAFFAIAKFRKVTFGQMLYGGDDVGGSEWDMRDWHRQDSVREKLLLLAIEAVLEL